MKESVRLQVVMTGKEVEKLNEWCRSRGFVKKNGNVNHSAAIAFLIRREIDLEARLKMFQG